MFGVELSTGVLVGLEQVASLQWTTTSRLFEPSNTATSGKPSAPETLDECAPPALKVFLTSVARPRFRSAKPPGGPSGPRGPVAPCGPAGPVAPSAPFWPGIPCWPWGPAGPAGPCAPSGPAGPRTPP